MAKKSKKKIEKKAPSVERIEQTTLLDALERPRNIIIFFAVLFFFIALFYKPLAFDGLEVSGTDVVSAIGKAHQLKEYEKRTGEQPLWNPYMFSGMPLYQRLGPVVWSIDIVLNKLDAIMDWRVWYLWAGAIGMFLLIKYLGLSAIAGILAAISFILMPHFHALIAVGHFAKLRALIWIPFVLLTFMMLIERRNLLSALLFTFAFALQMRTQHYQIIFYTLLLLLFAGIAPYLKLAIEKKWGDFLKLNGLGVASVILVVLIVAQPLFVIRDYAPYSTRGGNSISIEQQPDEDKKGVGFDYATQWSYSISELWNLAIAKFHGGTSQEKYSGDSVPQFRDRTIPAYWGTMPFTQSYEYMGIFLIFLALVAILFRWNLPIVKSLVFLSILALLLSLGKNFSPLYKLFFYYLPYFDKFRSPMMILTLVMFNVSVLAAFGLDFLLNVDFSKKEFLKKLYVFSGVFFLLLIIPLIFGSSFALSKPQELQQYSAQYGPDGANQVLEMLRSARLDILKSSTLRSLVFLALGLGVVYALKRKWMGKDYIAVGMVILAGFDLGLLSHNYLEGKFTNTERIEKQAYGENAIDQIIKQDTSLYRVAPPLATIGNDTRWCYHYQSIGGYSPAKLQEIQDLIENNIEKRVIPDLPFNLNIYNMLNVKYIASTQRWSDPNLTFLGSDKGGNLNLFLNETQLPRAFFVNQVQLFSDGVERLKFMNRPDFDPAVTALLEKPLSEDISAPDSSWAKVTHFEPDKVIIKAYTDQNALMVISEVYYPIGWHAHLDSGEELEIYKTNHILRSVIVPAGSHTITMEFKPATFYTGVRLSAIGWAITYVGLLVLILRNYRNQIKAWFGRKRTGS